MLDAQIEKGRSHRVCRLLVDDAVNGPGNMARDELLLEQADRHGSIALRWYQWSPATLSLGYFQADDPAVLPELPRVRRLSGGGAIRHDTEWTYSFAAPREHVPQVGQLYEIFHEAIVSVLVEAGCSVAMRGQDDRSIDGNFLCFQRGDRHDIVVTSGPTAGTKIVGSAQRRRGRAVVQHGSVELATPIARRDRDEETLLIENVVSRRKFLETVSMSVAQACGVNLFQSQFSVDELRAAESLASRKYRHIQWSRDQRHRIDAVPEPSI